MKFMTKMDRRQGLRSIEKKRSDAVLRLRRTTAMDIGGKIVESCGIDDTFNGRAAPREDAFDGFLDKIRRHEPHGAVLAFHQADDLPQRESGRIDREDVSTLLAALPVDPPRPLERDRDLLQELEGKIVGFGDLAQMQRGLRESGTLSKGQKELQGIDGLRGHAHGANVILLNIPCQ